MKTTLLRNMSAAIAALFITMFSLPVAAQTKEAYVVCSTDGTSLTFYFDGQRASRPGTTYGIGDKRTDDNSVPAWAGTIKSSNSSVKQAAFDASFRGYKPTTTSCWFSLLTALENIAGMENLNTAEVTDMSYMFNGCSSLASLGLSGFNTSNVTDMFGMFFGCSSLASLDLSGFNTSNVTEMDGMFYGCSSLASLDLSGFNTSNVTEMDGMFYGCSSLVSLDLSGFNTSNVTDMDGMFYGCSSLASLDLSGFNTSNVTDMSYMFYGCSSLASLGLSGFNTSNVTEMDGMFYGCSSLVSLDLSGFNTSNVTDMSYMFNGCSSLSTIYCNDDWKSSVQNSTEQMFFGCTRLKGAVAYDVSKTDVSMANPETGYFTKKGTDGIAAPEAEAAARRKGICTLSGVKMQGTFGSQPAGVYIVKGRKVVKR